MNTIDDIDALEALYGPPLKVAIDKVARRMTPLYRRWIQSSRLCMLSTVGPEGTDCSPRGDEGPVVLDLDPGTLALPDWHGNNRIDSLRNIVADGRVSLLFMVPGSNNVVRVNGRAVLTDDADLRARFARKGRLPATVAVITIEEIYAQCARALMRAGTWSAGDQSGDLPSVGDLLAEATDGREGGLDYDRAWPARAAETLW